MNKLNYILLICIAPLFSMNNASKWFFENADGYILIRQRNGATLGYFPKSGIQILSVNGYSFKDLNRNGKLDIYEDWRQPFDKRAKNLASQLTIEEIGGLMLFSRQNSVPDNGMGYPTTYGGKKYKESGAKPSDLNDFHIKIFTKENVRHTLLAAVESPEVAARWNNNVQSIVEGRNHGIPVNIASDPRHISSSNEEFISGGGGKISMWSNTLGIAATFDPEIVRRFGKIAAIEYRALGIATALSPQVDIATEPRWFRFNGTFGEDPQLTTDMGRAYCEGFQTSTGNKEISNGWGYESVNAMVKHWPGGGSGEGGRDAHLGFGKYSVFPNNNLALHKKAFIEGAFKLKGKTKTAAAVMPYYTISVGQGDTVGNSFSSNIINKQLRQEAGYAGVVCTDWGITENEINVGTYYAKPWGVERLSVAERHYRIIKAGVDQFGGNSELAPVLEAYKMGVKEFGEQYMRKRFETSAKRILINIFQTGLFENPYLDPAETQRIVGNPKFMAEGYKEQTKSIVMVKNHKTILPINEKKKVYIPNRYIPETPSLFGLSTPAKTEVPVSAEIISKYYTLVDKPGEADFAIVFISSPQSGYGYDKKDVKNGGNGYVPISLQYNDYTAKDAREVSIAGGDPFESFTNRTYKGKSVKTANKCDLGLVLQTKKDMGNKPVIVALSMNVPTIVAEFEPYADAILITFDVQKQAVLDIVSGKVEPSALLPVQMPMDMHTVETQAEDTPHDMRCYVDVDGNTYGFAFGLNFKGVINDKRVKRYKYK